jgi:single-strand DNA-binding protein
MPQLNKVFLMGNLTRDPELRYAPSGSAVTELGLAVNRSWTGKDGDRKEEVLFIDVTVWDRQAETCCQYLKKGRPIHVEGYLKMDEWTDKTTGDKRTKVKVQAERIQFLDRRDDAGGGASEGEYSSPAREAPPRRGPSNGPARGLPPQGRPAPPPRPAAEPDEGEDDIPF